MEQSVRKERRDGFMGKEAHVDFLEASVSFPSHYKSFTFEFL